jgi:hypothetical protein
VEEYLEGLARTSWVYDSEYKIGSSSKDVGTSGPNPIAEEMALFGGLSDYWPFTVNLIDTVWLLDYLKYKSFSGYTPTVIGAAITATLDIRNLVQGNWQSGSHTTPNGAFLEGTVRVVPTASTTPTGSNYAVAITQFVSITNWGGNNQFTQATSLNDDYVFGVQTRFPNVHPPAGNWSGIIDQKMQLYYQGTGGSSNSSAMWFSNSAFPLTVWASLNSYIGSNFNDEDESRSRSDIEVAGTFAVRSLVSSITPTIANSIFGVKVNGATVLSYTLSTSTRYENKSDTFHVDKGDYVNSYILAPPSLTITWASVMHMEFTPDPPEGGGDDEDLTALVNVEGLYNDPLGTKKAFRLSCIGDSGGALTNNEVTHSKFLNAVSGNKLVGSVWVKSYNGATTAGRLFVDSGSQTSSNAFITSDTWSRVSIDLTMSSTGSGMCHLILALDAATTSMLFFAPQLEIKSTTSAGAYVETRRPGEIVNWNNAEVILNILENLQYGSGMPCNRKSFYETIRYGEGSFPLDTSRIDAVYPTIEGGVGQIKDSIEALAQLKFLLLDRKSGVWELEYAKADPDTSVKLGTEDTRYSNVADVSPISFAGVDELVSKVAIQYGQTIREDTGEVFFPFRINQDIRDFGTELVVDAPYIRSHVTAKKLLYNLVDYNTAIDRELTIRVGNIGRLLDIGKKLHLYVPHDQVENRIDQPERIGLSPYWTASNITLNAARSPNNKSRSATKLNTNGSVSQALLPVSQFVDNYFCVWIKSAVASPFNAVTISLTSTTGFAVTQSFYLTSQWKKVDLNLNDPLGDGTCTVAMASTDCLLWGAQYCTEYKYLYTNKTVTAQTSWLVKSISESGRNVFDLTLVPTWDETPIPDEEYRPYDPNIIKGIDPNTVPPIVAQSIAVPPDPPVVTGLGGIEISPEGETDSWVEVQFIMPSFNISYAIVQYRQSAVDGLQLPSSRWQEAGRVRVEEVGYGGKGSVRISKLTPGLQYETRVITYNVKGLSAISIEYPFIARGDTTAPLPPQAVQVNQGTGRMIDIRVILEERPADMGNVILYRSTSVAEGGFLFTDTEEVERGKKTQFHDTGIGYGTTYYYWAIVTDLSDNRSEATLGIDLNSGTPGTEVSRITGIDELEAGTVTAGTLNLDGGEATLDNADLEDGDVGWVILNGSTPNISIRTVGSTYARSGTNAWAGVSPSTYNAILMNGTTVSVSGAENWTAEVWARSHENYASPLQQATVRVRIYGYTSGGTTIDASGSSSLSAFLKQGNSIPLSESYTKCVAQTTLPANCAFIKGAVAVFSSNTFPGISVYIDDLRMFEAGAQLRFIMAGAAGGSDAPYRIPVFDPNDGTTLGFIKLFTT